MAFSLLLVAGAHSYPLLLLAFFLSFPASGAFVTLSQATLMDLNPGREPHMMARWTVAGTLGNLIGPLLLAGGFSLALGWRWAYVFLALFGIALTLLCMLKAFPAHLASNNHSASPARLLSNLREAARNPGMLRWIGLLQASDLMMDVFTGFLALYLTDLAGATPAQASLILGAAMLADLGSDLVLIPLLERIPGRSLVRASAGLTAGLYILWLLVPGLAAKVVLLLLIRFFTLGWYQILQGEAYASLPGKSATVAAVDSLAGFAGSLVIWTLGLLADRFSLGAAMWLLLIGPVSLWLFVPRRKLA
jgi:FSR family fosmidomycin resistance protein-like MFS transporter